MEDTEIKTWKQRGGKGNRIYFLACDLELHCSLFVPLLNRTIDSFQVK